MINKGVYAAGLSLLNDDFSLNVDSTIAHATNLINNGLHGVFFFGSTGQSQLISMPEKKNLISNILWTFPLWISTFMTGYLTSINIFT